MKHGKRCAICRRQPKTKMRACVCPDYIKDLFVEKSTDCLDGEEYLQEERLAQNAAEGKKNAFFGKLIQYTGAVLQKHKIKKQ